MLKIIPNKKNIGAEINVNLKDSTILEVGKDENYLMIIHNDTPIITVV